jgi:hypothetical protein
VNTAQVGLNKNTAQSSALTNGTLLDRGDSRVVPSSDASGTITFDARPKGLGLFLAHLMGLVTGPTVQGATTAFLTTATLGDNLGKSLSMQVGIPDLAGLLHPYNFSGGKVTSTTFECDQSGILGVSADLDFQQYQETSALVVPSYATDAGPYHFRQESVKVGPFGSEAAIQGVTKVAMTYARPQDTGRFYANNAGLKSEPVTNDVVAVTGTVSADLVNKANLADNYASDTPFSMVVAYTSTVLAGTAIPFAITFALPECYLNTGTPQLGGKDVVNGDYTYTCEYDGSHLPTITYMSTDTTL